LKIKIKINKWFIYTNTKEEPYITDFTNEKVSDKEYDRFCREIALCVQEQIFGGMK